MNTNLAFITFTKREDNSQIKINPLMIGAIIEEGTKIKILVNSEWFSLNETLDELNSKLKEIIFN